ncbi:gliding motility associated protien GldN [Catalinimonas alkaloidigena]|uniref:Gliding motility associated protien GldN n=1 Tax=Catalinimonas alkaloidigena TaxID=1075417 RepID=A0A1G9MNH5_9BACT|nr:gliding motility protein GldN [Catalinimonas alkaloidigena]SDL75836.1 gliding motility associated protien GldN [Catalinimonas alkaloidigena]
MKNWWKIALGAALTTSLSVTSYGQDASDYGEDGYNHNSVHPIHQSDQMYRMGIWRRINLKNKVNAPFFAQGNEITKIIIDAVKEGRLVPYQNDSLKSTMTREEFVQKITMEDEGLDADAGLSDDLGFGDGGFFEGDAAAPAVAASNEYFPQDLYLMELREDLIFDKTRSRMYYDILALSMILPAEKTAKGIDEPIATFRFKDLVEVFEQTPNAKWYNTYNRAEDKQLADAFELRLFHSYIIKMSNPRDQQLTDIYNSDALAGMIASQQMEHKIIEWENDLWDY